MGPKVYSPQEFFARNDLGAPLVLTGMVKKEENDDQFVSFAVGTSCSNWRRVPADAIEGIEHLRDISCQDHMHPLVNVSFKRPQSDEGLLFASLTSDMKVEAHRIITKVAKASRNGDPTKEIDQGSCANCLNYCGTVSMDQFFQCYAFCLDVMCPDT
ncbi:hypothetical protein ACH4E7_43450 [Kitasatospora sp. NPDC018058]|uniref:hypothetical protein n=1 Tax=Kitasatospora sp. NPDC018058 TaxID=3364025 RepID=UPI0037C11355